MHTLPVDDEKRSVGARAKAIVSWKVHKKALPYAFQQIML